MKRHQTQSFLKTKKMVTDGPDIFIFIFIKEKRTDTDEIPPIDYNRNVIYTSGLS